MSWVEIFAVAVVCHLVGDYLLQTDWQATHKRGGLGPNPEARRALLGHVATYTLAFVPMLVWLLDDLGAGVAGIAALIAVPHFVQDDGRLLSSFTARVKGPSAAHNKEVLMAVDQTFHVLVLFGIALLAAS